MQFTGPGGGTEDEIGKIVNTQASAESLDTLSAFTSRLRGFRLLAATGTQQIVSPSLSVPQIDCKLLRLPHT